MTAATLDTPAAGWTCFHCGETFLTPDAARNHFGSTPARVPGCILKAESEHGLLAALRNTEDQRDKAVSERGLMVFQVLGARSISRSLLTLIDSEFEDWWEQHGQYCRAGGGQYEKTFAYRAWEGALKRAAERLQSGAG